MIKILTLFSKNFKDLNVEQLNIIFNILIFNIIDKCVKNSRARN